MKKKLRFLTLVLSLVCLLSIVGCQSQPEPISSEEPSSVTADLPEPSQEPVSSQVEEPVSSEPSVAESKPQPEVSSQPEPSSVPEEPSSVVESSEPELPTIPFEVGYQRVAGGWPGDLFEGSAKYDFKSMIVDSEENLSKAVPFGITDDEKKIFFDKYDANYFKENVILVLELYYTSYNTEYLVKIDSIIRSEDQLTINLSHDYPEETEFIVMDGALGRETIYIDIKQADMEGVSKIVVMQGKRMLQG